LFHAKSQELDLSFPHFWVQCSGEIIAWLRPAKNAHASHSAAGIQRVFSANSICTDMSSQYEKSGTQAEVQAIFHFPKLSGGMQVATSDCEGNRGFPKDWKLTSSGKEVVSSGRAFRIAKAKGNNSKLKKKAAAA
jgi:hypothetical protein